MKLIIFDIDGTLTNTHQVDTEIFSKTYKELFDFDTRSIDWSECQNYTDTGIAEHVFQTFLGRPVGKHEIAKIKKHLLNNFMTRFEESESSFSAVQGADEFLSLLNAKDNYAVAIATGCWEDPAIFKLNCAGIEYDEIPMAHADIDKSREGIIQAAIAEASSKNGVLGFDKIFYFGDGLWDLKATSNLGIELLGIDCSGRGQLQAAGLQRVANNFQDQKMLLSWLD